jgi:hypothetical protein
MEMSVDQSKTLFLMIAGAIWGNRDRSERVLKVRR